MRKHAHRFAIGIPVTIATVLAALVVIAYPWVIFVVAAVLFAYGIGSVFDGENEVDWS